MIALGIGLRDVGMLWKGFERNYADLRDVECVGLVKLLAVNHEATTRRVSGKDYYYKDQKS